MEESIVGLPGVLVACGLGSPRSRAICAFAIAGTAAYLTKFPRVAFTRDGRVAPQGMAQFLMVPVGAAFVAGSLI